MSNVAMIEIDSSHLRLDFEVSEDEVNSQIKEASKMVAQLKQRPLGVKQLGDDPVKTEQEAIATRATRAVIETALRNAIEENSIRLIQNPKFEAESLVKPDEPYSFSVVVKTVPMMGISDYNNLDVHFDANTSVSESDIDSRLEEIRGRAASIEKDSQKPIKQDDILEISFESFIDDEEYEGNKASCYTYTVGSGALPKEFDNGLIGMKSGEAKTIEFYVPDDFENEEIAGKLARFEVVVNRVASCEYPDIDDSFARAFGYPDLCFWRDKIRGELEHQKNEDLQEKKEKAAREALASLLIGDVDESYVNAHATKMLEAFRADLKQQGTSLEEYCRFLGFTEKDVKDEMSKESLTLLQENLALESLFRNEKMAISQSDLKVTVDQLAEDNAMPNSISYDDFNSEQQMAVREMTMHRLATEWLIDHANFIEEQ